MILSLIGFVFFLGIAFTGLRSGFDSVEDNQIIDIIE